MNVKTNTVLKAIFLTEARDALCAIAEDETLLKEEKERRILDLLDNPDKLVLDATSMLRGSEDPSARLLFEQLIGGDETPEQHLRRHYAIITSWPDSYVRTAKQMALSALAFPTEDEREQAGLFLKLLINAILNPPTEKPSVQPPSNN